MKQEYLSVKKINILPRLPLEGKIDLTYRCNNNCRHCWLRISLHAQEKKDELSVEEIKHIVDEAKAMGCHRWSISGGEPMLRPDFAEIFDYITANSASYSINTNGSLITPKIAQLMKRRGVKMVALYGATAKAHDHITRAPGSFEATMRGFRYLKEAAAGFIVQLVPMRDNYHQFPKMVALAESLSKHYRIGAPWLYLSACGDPKINAQIEGQRLDPQDVVELDKPDLSYDEWMERDTGRDHCNALDGEYLFSSCVAQRRDFHIDPYGKMTFCCFLKHPEFRYDLRKGDFKECWEEFIPSLAKKATVTEGYKNNCGSCELRKDCRFCPVYAYLEHGRFDARVDYLCKVAKENRKFRENWQKEHCRYYKVAGITIQVNSDLPITDNTFQAKFKYFSADDPGKDTITIRHHFSFSDLNGKNLGKEFYRGPLWAIYKKGDSWIYRSISSDAEDKSLDRIVVFNHGHTRARIYSNEKESFLAGNLHSLTLLSSDQIMLGRVLADREGCCFHSSGVSLDGQGLLFAGRSGAGKSTIAKMLRDRAKILGDDQIIVRKQKSEDRNQRPDFRMYGAWGHGEEAPEVSSGSAPLKAMLFLKKADRNCLELLKDKTEINKRLLAFLVKPFITVDWWEKMLSLIDTIAGEVPCYVLYFDKSGGIVEVLERFVNAEVEAKAEVEAQPQPQP